jgi:hypothetical protein
VGPYLGDFRSGKTVRRLFPTNAIAGESITIATNGTVQVYKNNGTSQSTAGVTFTEDFDGLVGVHAVDIDMSADGTFYSSASDFECVLAAATIDGKSINTPLFCWSVENRSAVMPTADGRTIDLDVGGNVDVATVNTTVTANLATTGLDTVRIESGISASAALTDDAGTQLTYINGRQTLSVILAALVGVLQGAEGLSITIKGAGLPAGNTRITATVDTDENRDSVILKVPT